MPFIIHADGSFDLESAAGCLRNCWPGIDLEPIRCSRIERGADQVTYHVAAGKILLHFAEDGIDARLLDFDEAPHWFQPICAARMEGFTDFFRQGIGFSGPTGSLNFEQLGQQSWSYESYLHQVLFNQAEDCFAIYPTQQRDYVFRSNIRQTVFNHNFRNREIGEVLQHFSCGFRCERIAAGAELRLPKLFIAESQGLYDTLQKTVTHIADENNARAPSTPRYHYCAWYHHTSNLTEPLFIDAINGMKKVDPARQMQAAQIDDGYCTSRGDWLTFKKHLWPDGLEPVFEQVADAGYDPGIWVAPFMVGSSSRLAAEHPDWLLHDKDGNCLVEWKRYRHGSPDFEHYILDSSHPDAMAWIKTVFETFYSWGVRVYKTDFLEWGFKDSTNVKRYAPGKTGAQYFDDMMSCIRTAIKDSYWLGCITYFAPSIGYMDGMRMTSDVGVEWSRQGGTGNDGCGGGTENMIEESFATLYMNNILWQNDPDVTFVRDFHIDLSDTEIKTLAHYNGLMGHSVNTSCEIGTLNAERLKLWQWLRPQAEPFSAVLPYFTNGHSFRVVLRDYPQANGWALLILNEHAEKKCGIVPVSDLIDAEEIDVYRWNQNGSEAIGKRSQFTEELNAHDHALYFLSRDGKAPPNNLNLGGSFEG